MKFHAKMNLAAKTVAAALCLASLAYTNTASAGIPVIDAGNLSQNIVTALENVTHTAKQIQQYQTQLQQYENMLQNSVAPAAYIWDQAQATMASLNGAINTLQGYKTALGSVDNYLNKFQDLSYYRNSSCFTATGCTAAQFAAISRNADQLAMEAQKKANDAVFKGLDQQQTALQTDAAKLQRLQSSAQGAAGQMAAIQFANQLASNQASQLLQIRSLLIAEQNMVATRNQALADQEAKQKAAGEQLRRGSYTASTTRSF